MRDFKLGGSVQRCRISRGDCSQDGSQHLLYHDECSLIERKFHILTYEAERGKEHLDLHSLSSF